MNHQVLFPIVKLLKANQITYALGGSGLLYYLKLIDSVNDWDITIECSKDTLTEAIKGYDWVEQKSGDYPFASQFRLSVDSPRIDFIGRLALYSEEEVIPLPVSTLGEWDGIKLSSLEVWYCSLFFNGQERKGEYASDLS